VSAHNGSLGYSFLELVLIRPGLPQHKLACGMQVGRKCRGPVRDGMEADLSWLGQKKRVANNPLAAAHVQHGTTYNYAGIGHRESRGKRWDVRGRVVSIFPGPCRT